MAERPTFLSIICILLAIVGILMLIVGLAIVVIGDDLERTFLDVGIDIGTTLTVIGFVAIIEGVIALATAYFLWIGNKIGWFLAMIFLVINAIVGILSFPAGLLNLLITILLIWYFLRPNVRGYFGI